MANPTLEGLLSHYQSLGVAPSMRRTYQAGVRALQQFCNHYTVLAFPALPLLLLPHGMLGFLQNYQGVRTLLGYA